MEKTAAISQKKSKDKRGVQKAKKKLKKYKEKVGRDESRTRPIEKKDAFRSKKPGRKPESPNKQDWKKRGKTVVKKTYESSHEG